MVSSRKRTIDEVSGDDLEEPSLLHQIRNMWQFANLCQWIYIFGKVVKIDDRLDTEEIETECLKPDSHTLQEIGLALLKSLSSHRGLTHELFDEYTRRQYVSKAPEKHNPFGTEEVPVKFAAFDIFTKIRILQQMTVWIMRNPEKVREKMEEGKDSEQTQWRIEPMGWDCDDRTYFVLDDNRVYRLTDAPLEPAPPKKKSKAARKGGRASKRRRVSATQTAEEAEDADPQDAEPASQVEPQDDGLEGMKWECLAVSLDEVRNLVASFRKTRDENEKILRDQLEEHLLPILEKQEESRKRKEVQREKELLNLAKLANAKRSSRLANKHELQKLEEKAREDETRRRVEEAAAEKARRKQLKMEKERDERLMSREKRLQEREARRLLHEEELANLSEDSKQTGDSGRMSERRLQAEISKRKQALQELAAEEEEDDWIFDCVCGAYGQVDDGTHSIACERCSVWQHSKCVGIREEEAEHTDFHFICSTCRRREEEAKSKPRTTIKLKVSRPDNTESSPSSRPPTADSSLVAIPPVIEATQAATTQQRATVQATNDVTMTGNDNFPQYGQSSSFKVVNGVSEAPPTSSEPDLALVSQAQLLPSLNGSSQHSAAPSAEHAKINGVAPVTPGFGLGRRNDDTALPFSSPSKSSVGRPVSRSPTREIGISSSPIMGGASLLATPGIDRDMKNGDVRHPSTLPSSEAGYSPTKYSPAVPRPESASSAFSRTSNFPAVFPPVTTLAPSPQQPILTPPTKQPEPPRPQPPEFVKPAEGQGATLDNN